MWNLEHKEVKPRATQLVTGDQKLTHVLPPESVLLITFHQLGENCHHFCLVEKNL